MIAFTICSNNYLAHAKTLADSFLQFHPDVKFIIGLADRPAQNFDYSFFSGVEIIPVEELGLENLGELSAKYNITEFNTAVKPTYFKYLFTKYKEDKVIYIDPDILVTSRLTEVFRLLDETNIVLTPHICKPIDDEFGPTDYHILMGGVFNLGFIALSHFEKVIDFLNWWHDRVMKYGFANTSLGMFYDQIWVNYVPALYDNYAILKHPGYNMANWNLHERSLSKNAEGRFMVNEKYELCFFHFSSYHYDKPHVICAYLSRYNFESRPDLVEIFSLYTALLKKNKVEEIKRLGVYFYPHLSEKNKGKKNKKLVEKVFSRVKRSAKVLLKGHD